MVQINFAQKQVNAKVVYYGPGMSGKTTNLEIIHQRAPDQNRGDLTSISTDGDRTLFFDFMPLDLGTVAGMRTCFQIYTVPGQVYYNSTRKLVLQGVDGVVFVADSSASMVEENLESMRNLEENLNEYGKSLSEIALVIQYNKRDLPDALPVDELNQLLNPSGAPTFEGVANTGQGVFPTLKALASGVLDQIHQSYGAQSAPSAEADDAHISTGTTGFYQAQPQQPVAPPAAAQTGFYQAQQPAQQQPVQQPAQQEQFAPAAAQQQPQQPAPQQPAPQAGVHQQQQPFGGSQPMSAQNLGGDPMAQTQVHGPPQPAGGGDQGPQLRMASASQAVVQQAPPQQAPAQHSQAQAMQVDPGAVAPQPQAPAARSFPVAQPQNSPRLHPRAAARPTPAAGKGNKNALFTGLFVVAALGAGAVLGRLVLTLF